MFMLDIIGIMFEPSLPSFLPPSGAGCWWCSWDGDCCPTRWDPGWPLIPPMFGKIPDPFMLPSCCSPKPLPLLGRPVLKLYPPYPPMPRGAESDRAREDGFLVAGSVEAEITPLRPPEPAE